MSPRKHALDSDSDNDYEPDASSKRSRQEDTSSDDSEYDKHWRIKPTKAKRPIRTKPSSQSTNRKAAVKLASRASILSLASTLELDRRNANEKLAGIDSSVIGKIKKALALGGHRATGEAEAKRAMRLATKLMAQHNVDQADILAAEKDSEKLKRAGQSTVTIKSTNPKHGVVVHSWSLTAANAMDVFFDCKSYNETFDDPEDYYSDRTVRIDWTFYGLCEQTVAAAFAFEMVYNLILTWGAQNKQAQGRSGKNTYCHGVADGLFTMARREKAEEETRTRKKETMRLANARVTEEEERKRALERLEDSSQPPGTNIEYPEVKKETLDKDLTDAKREESVRIKIEEVPDEDVRPSMNHLDNSEHDAHADGDDDDEFIAARYDQGDAFEAKPDFRNKGNDDVDWMLDEPDEDFKPANCSTPTSAAPAPYSSPVKKEELEDTPWSSAQQLTLFRSNASSIADEYLKQNKIRICKGPARLRPKLESTKDRSVYRQGRSDAKNIDVKRKRIKDADED